MPKSIHGFTVAAALCTALPLAAASAAKLVTVYNFTGGADGAIPYSALTEDTFGNFYGTTLDGGINPSCATVDGCGTIFKLDKSGHLATLYAFPGGIGGGDAATGVSLIRGLLYGGTPSNAGLFDSVLYSIGTDGSNYAILYNMTRTDGAALVGVMQPSPAGGEFGLGRLGGTHNDGTLFYLNPFNVLFVAHDFAGGTDGQSPSYLIEGANHTLFGSTRQGGAACPPTKPATKDGCGTIFEYVPKTRIYTVLYARSGHLARSIRDPA